MFTYPALLWLLPLAGVVVLIHLINLFRHRRVPWAAFEFLLISYKKSRVRILLQQFLLILLRTLAVLAIILMLAKPQLQGRFADWVAGGKPTLHLVLLDDSFSMSERNLDQNAFDSALDSLRKIVEQATQGGETPMFSLLRFSQIRESNWDFREQRLDSEGIELVKTRLQSLGCSESAVGPDSALDARRFSVAELVSKFRPVVYLISDFRQKDWIPVEPIRERLVEMQKQGAAIRLIRTVETEQPNLAIRKVNVLPGIQASEIPILVEATIMNFGTRAVEKIVLNTFLDGRSQPVQHFANLAPEKETTFRFPIRFPSNGETVHRIRIQLEPDAIMSDNSFEWCMDVPEELPVLLIDPLHETRLREPGSDSANGGTSNPPDVSEQPESVESEESAESGAKYLRTALAPKGLKTGIRVQTESPSFLSTNPLERFRVVILLDAPALEGAAVRALESFVHRGGGVAFFTGPQTAPSFVNEKLYRTGKGIFPLALRGEETLVPDFLNKQPDLRVESHPLFRVFEQDGGVLLGSVAIDRYFSVLSDPGSHSSSDSNTNSNTGTSSASNSDSNESKPGSESESAVTISARIRNGAPFVAEKRFGAGKSLVFLSSAAPIWNNWGRGNPSFVITMLELVAYLSENRTEPGPSWVDTPITFSFDPASFENTVRVSYPADSSHIPTNSARSSLSDSASGERMRKSASIPTRTNAAGMNELRFDATSWSGIYEFQLERRAATGSGGRSPVSSESSHSSDSSESVFSGTTSDLRLFAVNVDSNEGNPRLAEKTALADALRPYGFSIENAASFSLRTVWEGSRSLCDLLFGVVVLLLVSEMFLSGIMLRTRTG